VERAGLDSVQRALTAGARQLLQRGDCVTMELLAAARRADLKVVAWTVNEPAEMRELVEVGVDGIITDYPDRLTKVLMG